MSIGNGQVEQMAHGVCFGRVPVRIRSAMLKVSAARAISAPWAKLSPMVKSGIRRPRANGEAMGVTFRDALRLALETLAFVAFAALCLVIYSL